MSPSTSNDKLKVSGIIRNHPAQESHVCDYLRRSLWNGIINRSAEDTRKISRLSFARLEQFDVIAEESKRGVETFADSRESPVFSHRTCEPSSAFALLFTTTFIYIYTYRSTYIYK